MMLEELLAFPDSAQRLAFLVELRKHPGTGSDRKGKQEDDVPSSDHRDHALKQLRLRPVALEEVENARGSVSLTKGGRMASRLG